MMFRDIVVISIVILSFGSILSIDFPIVSNVENNSLSKFIVLIIMLLLWENSLIFLKSSPFPAYLMNLVSLLHR